MKKIIISFLILLFIPAVLSHGTEDSCTHGPTKVMLSKDVVEYTGERITSYVTINNTDSGCFSRGYTLNVSIPSDWTAYYSAEHTVSSGRHATVSVALVPPSNLANGVYEVPINAIHYETGASTILKVYKGVPAPSTDAQSVKEGLKNETATPINGSETNNGINPPIAEQPKIGFWERIGKFFKNLF